MILKRNFATVSKRSRLSHVDEHGVRFPVDVPVADPKVGYGSIILDLQVEFRRTEPHERTGEDEMTSFALLQVVELMDDFPNKGVARGMRGTIVEKFDYPSEAYDIEIVSDAGMTEILLSSILPNQIRPV